MSDRINILLIEDSPSDQRLIRSLLSDVQSVQFDCECTDSLGDGLARLSTGEFQAVLLDLSLPDSHGLETYERVVPVCESIPVIVLTGHEDEELALAALERGAQDYLTKGEISSDLLARTLRYAMGRKRAEEALQRARTELEERVRERTAELTAANRELAHEVQVRVQAERAVRDSERLLKQFVEAMPVGVFVAHVDGTPYFANQLAVELFGPEILQTRSLEDLARVFRGFQSGSDQVYAASRTPVMRALQGEKSSIADMVVERNNRRIPLQAWGSPVLDSSGNVRLAVTAFVDISERLAIEERARQTQQDLAHLSRLNTMGEMASGLAHELNQPLMAIVAFIRSCILNLNTGQWQLENDRDQLCKVLEDAAAESLRAGEIIRRLRRLVKKHAAERLPTDLNDAIREICSMVKTEAHVQKIQLKLDLQSDLPEVPVDRVQIQQVVLNLVRNAFDAILQADSDVRIAQVSTRMDGDIVHVTVSDTGPRIPDEDVAKFFEPFFTQKERGLGMGLPISRSIIESHQGTLSIQAQPSGGLCARFSLPMNLGEGTPWAPGRLPNQANQ